MLAVIDFDLGIHLHKYHMQKKYYEITSPEHVDHIRAAVADQALGCALIQQGREGDYTYTLVLHIHQSSMVREVETRFEGMIVEASWPE